MKQFWDIDSIIVGVLVLFLTPSLILASTIPITGNAHAGPSDFGFSFSGPSLSLFSSTFDFVPGDQSGNKIPASFNEDGVFPNESGGTVDGVTADILVGVLTVSPSYGPGQIPSQPATASGVIYGYQLNPMSATGLGPLLWSVDINATGTLSLNTPIGVDETAADYTFTSGTATVTLTPEPASLLLFATGLLALSLLAHWRMKKSKSAAV
jgi:hypothetical protein